LLQAVNSAMLKNNTKIFFMVNGFKLDDKYMQTFKIAINIFCKACL